MVTSKLFLITALVFAGTAYSVREYVNCCEVRGGDGDSDRSIEMTGYGDSILPLYETIVPTVPAVPARDVKRAAQEMRVSKRAERERKATGASARKRVETIPATPVEPARGPATIQLFESSY